MKIINWLKNKFTRVEYVFVDLKKWEEYEFCDYTPDFSVFSTIWKFKWLLYIDDNWRAWKYIRPLQETEEITKARKLLEKEKYKVNK
jgi:hypothetical protein